MDSSPNNLMAPFLNSSITLDGVNVLYLNKMTSTYMTDILAETALFGVHSMLAIVSLAVLIRKGWRHRPRLFVITACIALYSMSVWHWATTVYYSLVIVSTLTTAMSGGVDCVKRILLGSFCPVAFQNMVSGYYEGPGDTMEIAAPLHVCVTTTPLSISIIIGDMVVLWRALVLWRRNLPVQVVSVGLLLSTIGTSVASVVATCTGPLGQPPKEFAYNEFTDKRGVAAFTLSWITNIWATSLIAYRAWMHRRTLMRNKMQDKNWLKKTSRILLIFLESGIICCVLWTCLAVSSLLVTYTPTTHRAMDAFYFGMSDFKQSALVNIIGIYPTALILAIALSDSYAERALQEPKTWDLQLPSTSLPRDAPNPSPAETNEEETNVHFPGRSSFLPADTLSTSPQPLTSRGDRQCADE